MNHIEKFALAATGLGVFIYCVARWPGLLVVAGFAAIASLLLYIIWCATGAF
jgi:hypothetical protein